MLDRRITIERANVVLDDLGEETETWGVHATVWAAYRRGPGVEKFTAAEVAASATARFLIRWGQGVTVEDRIIYEGRVHEIVDVAEIGRREGQEIFVRMRAE